MKISFTLNSTPMSLNDAYYHKRTRKGFQKIRNTKFRDWCENIFKQMHKPIIQEKIEKCNGFFNEKKHFIKFDVTHYIPKDIFFTKKGTISLRSKDLSNVEKLLIDVIFDKRYKDKGVNNIYRVNDKFICDLNSKKRPSDNDFFIVICIEIVPLSGL